MWIKFSFNYRWVRSQVLTFGLDLCKNTRAVPKKGGKMLRALGREKNSLLTCLGPSWICVWSSHLGRWSSPSRETQTQLWPCEQRGSVAIPPVRVNQQKGKLMSWVIGHANEIWVSASWLFYQDQKFGRFFVLWVPGSNVEFRRITLVVWIADCFWWPHALWRRTQPPSWSRCGLFQERGADQTLALGDKEPCTAVWDQTALAPNAGRQAKNTGQVFPLLPEPHPTHTPQLLCAIKVKQVAQTDFTPLTKHLPAKILSACCNLHRQPPKKAISEMHWPSAKGGQLCPGAAATAGLGQETSRQHKAWESTPLSDPLKTETRK